MSTLQSLMPNEYVFVDLSVSPYSLQVGDVINLDSVPYLVQAVDSLTWSESVTVTQGGTATDQVTNLSPSANQLYWIDSVGIDGQVQVSLQYPQGATRGSPHGKQVLLDQTIASKGNPFKFKIWITMQTFPVLSESMPVTSPSSSSTIWFYGLQFWVQAITPAQAMAVAQSGKKILYATSAFQPTGNQPVGKRSR